MVNISKLNVKDDRIVLNEDKTRRMISSGLTTGLGSVGGGVVSDSSYWLHLYCCHCHGCINNPIVYTELGLLVAGSSLFCDCNCRFLFSSA